MCSASLEIEVSLGKQRLFLKRGDVVVKEYPVSASRHGAGEREGSECTPCGRHEVGEMIGAGAPAGTVFVGRRPTGEVYTAELGHRYPQCDWILSRILWLHGLEPGRNQGGGVDSRSRYIYIHGTADEAAIGKPASHGCIRMRNADIIELFEHVAPGTAVLIRDAD
ncbi:MAG: L,D-transpeptidase family protein [Gammaproteobacteria bacterium]